MRYLILIAVGWCAYNAFMCWLYPHTRCGGCDAGRKYEDDTKRNWRDHRRCHGTGKRLRFGRWAYNHLRRNAS